LSYGQLLGSTFISPTIGLATVGPRVQVKVGFHDYLAKKLKEKGDKIPDAIVGTALIDTGAAVTTIDSEVAKSLNLRPSGQVESCGIGGKVIGFTVACSIDIKGLKLNIPRAHCHDLTKHVKGLIALIGRDVLRSLILNYDGPKGEVELLLPIPASYITDNTHRLPPPKKWRKRR